VTAHQRTVQAEFLSPDELAAAVDSCPLVYLPLGTLEFHGAHLPIGLDALTAHGLCIRAAQRGGGTVLPPLYQGTGGGHSRYPWTIMMTTDHELSVQLRHMLERLEEFGVRLAVLFSGHFADEQLAMIDKLAGDWSHAPQHAMEVVATSVNRCTSSPLPPDHAGVFETTLLYALWPEHVHVGRLPSLGEHPATGPDDEADPAGNHRHNPDHPLWGIFGPDPRDFDRSRSTQLLEELVEWLTQTASNRLADRRASVTSRAEGADTDRR